MSSIDEEPADKLGSTFFEALRELRLSARAQAALDRLHASAEWSCLSLEDYLRDPDRVHDALRDLGNVGRRTLDEIYEAAMSCAELTSTSIGDRGFFEMFRNIDVSVRTQSALRELKARGDWQNLTVADYLRDSERVHGALRALRNVGRTTIREIHSVALCLTLEIPAAHLMSPYIGADGVVGPSEVAAEVPFARVLEASTVSSRIRKRLAASPIIASGRSLLDFIADRAGFQFAVLRDVGDEDAIYSEIMNAVGDLLAEQLARVLDLTTAKAIGAAVVACPRRIRTRASVPNLKQDEAQPSEPADVVTRLLEGLRPREREVLERRYGIGERVAETLEEIAEGHGVTRERIRQIEKKALGELARRPSLVKALEINSDVLWAQAGGSIGLLDDDLASARTALGGLTLLAVEAIYGSVSGWLSAIAVRCELGWFRDASASERFPSLLEALEKRLEHQPLPVPIPSLHCEDSDEASVAFALRASGRRAYLGYALDGMLGIRKRRTVRLHRMLSRSEHSTFELHDMLDTYRRLFLDDPCSGRDAIIVMENSPHLFIPILEDRWASLGPPAREVDVDHSAMLVEETAVSEPASESPEFSTERTSIAATVERVLEENGPLRYVDLRQKTLKVLGEVVAPASFGPILITSGRFTRIAPGLYGLPQHARDVAAGRTTPSAMLAVDQCRWFAMALRAGCSHGEFAAWTKKLELELCRWALEQNVDAIVLESLLAVVRPESWDVTSNERDYWSNLQQSRGRYHLDGALPSLLESPPTLERLAAAGLHACSAGGLNWISVNRIEGKRIDHDGAAAALALLVGAGVLMPAWHWQQFHSVAPNAPSTIEAILERLRRTGTATWQDAEGRRLLASIRIKNVGLGWVEAEQLHALVEAVELGRVPHPLAMLGWAVIHSDGIGENQDSCRMWFQAADRSSAIRSDLV